VVGFTGGSRAGGGFMFINLKPASERAKGESGQAVIARLRPKLARVTGVQLFLNPVQDLRMGGRQSNSTYQYTLKSDNRRPEALGDAPGRRHEAAEALTDVDTDQAENGVETYVDIDKQSAARLGISARDVDNALYNAFGQRQVANIYDELNQYHVIMGVAQKYAQSPEALKDVYVPAKAAPRAARQHGDQHRGHAGHTSATATGSTSTSASAAPRPARPT
jgi:multidrug efflux pump